MAAEHVDGLQALAADIVDPAQQGFVVTGLQGIDHEPGEKEIIDRIAFPRDFLVDPGAVLGMDFRKDGQTVFLCNAP